jgi:tetratricopeptide (TPR) repeat protein
MRKASVLVHFLLVLNCGWLSFCGINKTPKNPTEQSTSTEAAAPKPSIVQKIKEREHLPVGERIAWYRQLKKENAGAYNFENEDELTMYGYSKLWENKAAEALEIFKLIAQEFPNSANAYDSLGEGYLALGDTARSLKNYEKTLAMNPDNFNAEDQIERIKHPEKPVEKLSDQFLKVFTAKEYREDLDQLGKTLLKVHPNALKFISEKDFWQGIEQKKSGSALNLVIA